MKQLYTDSLVHDEQALKYLVSTVGVDRVVLGSDYPFPLGEHHPGKLVESILDWDQETKVHSLIMSCVDLKIHHLLQQNLLGMNAMKFLGLDSTQFQLDEQSRQNTIINTFIMPSSSFAQTVPIICF